MLPAFDRLQIPDGSSFTLGLSGDTGGCDASATVVVDGQQTATWSHDDLVAGKSLALSAPGGPYIVDLTINFVTDNSNVVVDAAVSDPQGNTVDGAYHETSAGSNGDHDATSFGMAMA